MFNNNNTLAVISQSGQSLSFYDLSSGALTGFLENLLAEPHELCYDESTNLLYISHAYAHGWYVSHGEDCSTISIVNCGKREIIGDISTKPYAGPHGMALDRSNNILYVSVEVGFQQGGGIIGIDLQIGKIVKAVGSGSKTHWFVMTPDGKKAYTCNKEAGFVSILDLVNERLLGRIEMPGGCEQPGISRDGKLAFFPTPTVGEGMKRSGKPGDFGIEVIDTESDRVVERIPLEFGALTVHVDAKDRLLVGQYLFDQSCDGPPRGLDGKLTVLAASEEQYRILASFDTGIAPLTIFSSLDGRKAFASAIFTGTVTVVDLDGMVVDKVLEVDIVERADKKMHQGAHGLALVP